MMLQSAPINAAAFADRIVVQEPKSPDRIVSSVTSSCSGQSVLIEAISERFKAGVTKVLLDGSVLPGAVARINSALNAKYVSHIRPSTCSVVNGYVISKWTISYLSDGHGPAQNKDLRIAVSKNGVMFR